MSFFNKLDYPHVRLLNNSYVLTLKKPEHVVTMTVLYKRFRLVRLCIPSRILRSQIYFFMTVPTCPFNASSNRSNDVTITSPLGLFLIKANEASTFGSILPCAKCPSLI